MTQTTHYASGHQTRFNVKIEIPRGADNSYEFEHSFMASEIQEAIFTARIINDTEPGTGTVVLQLTTDAHPDQWDLDTDEEGRIDFLDGDTDLLRRASSQLNLEYDIEFTLNNLEIVPIEVGTFTIQPTMTEDSGTAQYLTRATRAGLAADFDAVLAGHRSSALAAAAASGATDILVLDATPFAAGNTLNVAYDTGYDQRTISSIATNTISLSGGGLSGAASAGRIVIKVS